MSVTHFSKVIYLSSLICVAFILLESQYQSFFKVLLHEVTAKLVIILKPKVVMYINTFTAILKLYYICLECVYHCTEATCSFWLVSQSVKQRTEYGLQKRLQTLYSLCQEPLSVTPPSPFRYKTMVNGFLEFPIVGIPTEFYIKMCSAFVS